MESILTSLGILFSYFSFIVIVTGRGAGTNEKNVLQSYSEGNLTWVLVNSQTNQITACKEMNLFPTPVDEIIPWNFDVMKQVVRGLNRSTTKASQGIQGCCVAGLWCSDTECFTQSMESNFVNYHSTHPVSKFTVYTCTNIGDSSVQVDTVGFSQGRIVISGDHFGSTETNIMATFETSPCSNIEICHTVCQSCESSPCAKDNACVMVGSTYSCLMFCSGPSDTSCPCGTLCQHVNVYTSQNSYISTHFCAPKGLSCSNYNPSTINQFECKTPRIYNWWNDSGLDSTESDIFDISVSVDASSDDLFLTGGLNSCSSGNQCIDMSPYTSDTCEEGKCQYNTIETMGTISPAIRERNTAFTYLMFSASNMETEQDVFESRVRLDGELSPLSDVDDLPQQSVILGFPFTYFGNQFHHFVINANGLISFPPFVDCNALAGTLYCPVYGTGTNTIAIWGSDWDLRLGGDASTIHILNQTKNDQGYDVYGINANAFHVLYSVVYKYEQGSSRNTPVNPSTFSLSIYEDNSIRIRYHSLLSKQLSGDVFGLWGSRASNQNLEGTRYHEEAIEGAYRSSGNDVIFCYFSTIACAEEAVAVAQSTVKLSLIGNIPSCLALGETLLLKCIWLGFGSHYESTPSFDTVNSKVVVSCPVPSLNLEENTFVSLDLSFTANRSTLVSSVYGGKKSLQSKWYDIHTGELTSGHVMLRYFEHRPSQTYGCNPLIPTDTCDRCGVCGGNNTVVDCSGTCFGTAYIDSCGVCAGGTTGVYPETTCDLSSHFEKWNDGNMLDTLSKTILLLTMMICMTFVFSACMRVIRASFVGPDVDRPDGIFGLALPTNRRENGLDRFEIDALGQIQFVKDMKDPAVDPIDIESSSSCINLPLQPSLECSICLIEFNEHDHCRQLPCDHVFHTQCIDQWFTVSVVCPMCKRSVRSMLLGEEEAVTVSRPISSPAQAAQPPTPPSPSNPILNRPSDSIELTPLSGSPNRIHSTSQSESEETSLIRSYPY